MLKRIVALIVLFPSLLLAQHTIKGTFSPAEEFNFALLYKVTPTVSEYIDKAEVKKDGAFSFTLDSTAIKGMYRIVYAVPQEDYNFDVVYNAKEDIELTFNSETGVTFQKSVENKLLTSYSNSMSMVTQSIGNYFRQNSKDTTALNTIFKTQKETQSSFEKAAKNTIAFHFIKANKPYTPNSFQDVGTYIDNLKNHYFDYVDFNNEILQSSSFLEERILNYVFGMSYDDTDEVSSYKKNTDVVCGVMKNAPLEIKRILLVDLWQQMADLNLEEVANYISETYLMDIAVSLNDQELLHALIQYENLSIGAVAPDFSFEIKEDKKKVERKLSALNDSENYIVVFWSSTCSHCLDEIPQLQDFVKAQQKGKIKVIAVALEDDDIQWKVKTKTLPEFIHVYGKWKWDNEISNNYGVTTTPTYFILDTGKHIIAKPEDFEDLKMFLESVE